ncbi:MAG TPA: PAS domain S-box protein [Ignavibacteriaceae bacterium]|nr:PAS domain S-box protein [Ignavibacteriaceae bacterium]
MKNQYKNKTKSELVEEITSLNRKLQQLQNKSSTPDYSIEYNTIASTVLDGLFILSKKGFQSVNDTLAGFVGYTTEEFLATPLEKIIAPSHRKIVLERAEKRWAGEDVPNSYDVFLLHKNGKTLVPVTLSVSLLKTKKEPQTIGIVKDNSEKAKAKKELADLEKKFNAITNSAGDSIIIITSELKITYWNKNAEKTFGYKFSEAKGKNLLDLIFPDKNQEGVSEIIKRCRNKEKFPDHSDVFDVAATAINSTVFPAEISISIIDSPDEHHLIIILRDITERKEKDKLLAKERNLFQYFMDHIPFSIYFKDHKSRFIKVNKEAITKHRFENAADMLGKTDHDIFTKEHADIAREDELKLIRGEESIIQKVEKETWIDGRTTWVITTKVPLRNDRNEIIGTFGITRDFTQVKKAELIQQTLLRISTAVNSVEEMEDLYAEIHLAVKELMKADNFYIALYEEKTNILSFPYFVDEIDTKPEPRVFGRGLTEYIIRSGKAQLIDSELDLALRKLGETNLIGEPSHIWLGVPLILGDKTIGAVVVQDYSDPSTYGEEELRILNYVSEQITNAILKKDSEQQLKIYSRELQESNASKDKFFSIIAHDLKSPFQGLIGLSRLIVDEYDELADEELKSFVDALNQSAESTYSLIENLLEWSRLQTGRAKFNTTNVDLFNLIEEIKMLLFQTAGLKKIRIINKLDPNTTVWGDKHMLGSLFQNILSNSIKFTNRFGEIKIDSAVHQYNLEITIQDNGVGIDNDDLEKLFKIDSTFTMRGTEQEKGTGLGLILCREIVNRHGGNIRVESEKDRGTKVIFTLNIHESNE